MEDVLTLYQEAAETDVSRICFDERPCVLHGEVLAPLPPKANQTAKEHCEYLRNGVCNVLLAYDIDTGQRYVQVTETKKRNDYAQFMHWLVTTHYPDKKKICVIQDNYATHSKGSFYENLPLDQASALSRKLEFHYTPKHGSWLNMAEIEFSALSRQCLDHRIGQKDILEQEVLAWQCNRNHLAIKIDWSFTTAKARLKLKNRYQAVYSNNIEN